MKHPSIPPVRDQEYEDALDALATIYAAKRRPIIFVGSGLSAIYGAPLWNESVFEVVKQTIVRIERAAEKEHSHARRFAALQHFKAKLSVFERLFAEPDKAGSEDRFAALEVSQQALDLCRAPNPRGKDYNSANEILAEMVTGGRYLYRSLLTALGMTTQAAQRLRWFGGYRRVLAYLFDVRWMELHEAIASHPLLSRFNGTQPRIDQYYLFLPLLAQIEAEGHGVTTRLAHAMDLEGRRELADKLPKDLNPRPSVDPIRRLRQHFDVRRFITLNYDLELERALMFPDAASSTVGGESLQEVVRLFSEYDSDTAPFGRVARRMPDGAYVVSDVYSPRNAARLFEFSLNAPSQAIQILHLHGRADDPDGMVARDPDYARQYIKGSSNPQALRLALNVALCGNPVFFVGVGLSEPEVMDILRRSNVEDVNEPRNPPFAFVLSGEGHASAPGSDWRVQARNKLLYRVNVIHAGHARDGAPTLAEQESALQRLMSGERAQTLGLEDDEAALHHAEDIQGQDWAKAFRRGALTRLRTQAMDAKIVQLSTEVERLVIGGSRYEPIQCFEFEQADQVPVRHVIGTAGSKNSSLNALRLADEQPFEPQHAFGEPSTLILAPPLAGKGNLARTILTHYRENMPNGHYLSLNVGVVLEIDSAVTAIYAFLNTLAGRPHGDEKDRLNRIQTLLRQPLRSPALILLTGAERLFTAKARCIAPDFEQLLTLLLIEARGARDGPQVVVISSPNIEPWISQVRERVKGASANQPRVLKLSSDPPASGPDGRVRHVGVAAALEAQVEAFALSPPLGDRADAGRAGKNSAAARASLISVQRSIALTRTGGEAQARALLGLVLEHWPEDEDRSLAMALLRVMAAIGAPTTPQVLSHAPSVRAALGRGSPNIARDDVARIVQCIERLKERSLVSAFTGGRVTWRRSLGSEGAPPVRKIAPNRRLEGLKAAARQSPASDRVLEEAPAAAAWQEWCLHRLVLDEMRTRLGIPMGAEPMSNTFSLSIAASLPVSVTVPDKDMRDRLSELFSHLRGAWNDVTLSKDAEALLAPLAKEVNGKGPSTPDAVMAAGNSARLSLVHELARALAMAETPMAANLRAASDLLRSFFSATTLVMHDSITSPTGESPFVSHKRRIRKLFSSVRRHEGLRAHLYKIAAQLDFSQAQRDRLDGILEKNGAHIDEISLNSGEIIWLHNERGVISLLEGDLYEAEFSLSKALQILTETRGRVRGHNRNRIDLNRVILMIERGQLGDARVLLDEIQLHTRENKSTESTFIDPVAQGYRAMVAQLNGRSAEALDHYEDAIKGLVKTEQLRALGLMQMRRGVLWRAMGRKDQARLDFESAARSGEACSQLDVMWRAKLCLTSESFMDGGQTDGTARDALAFGERMGLHRVTVEALRVCARAAFLNGDLEEAAHLIARAMSIASSCGMTLRRISLRADMGAILMRQGDGYGEWLIRRSIDYAERIQYQSGVQNAQQALHFVRNRMTGR
jgi:tetratricopeptide (TPR) repeat protein